MLSAKNSAPNETPVLEDFSHPFVHFDLGLTPQEQQSLSELQITNTNSLRLYGNLENALSQIDEFLQTTGSAPKTALAVAKIILNFVLNVIAQYKKETAVVDVRVSLPNHLFDEPRWHTDGEPYPKTMEADNKPAVKAVAALVGPQTLFYRLPDEKRAEFNALGNNREKTAAMLRSLGSELRESSLPSQGTIFIEGPKGAVHSEPPISRLRLFVAAVPCSNKQRDEMQQLDMQAQTNPEIQALIDAEFKRMFPTVKIPHP